MAGSRAGQRRLFGLLEEIKNDRVSVKEALPSNLPIDTIFLNSLNLTIQKIKTEPNWTSMAYKPSSLQCLRKMYYQVGGMAYGETLEEADPSMVGIGETGTARHEHIQGYIEQMKSNGFEWEYISVPEYIKEFKLNYLEIKPSESKHETKLHNKDLNMTFLTDGILRYQGKYYFIFEYKTEISMKWDKRDGVDEKHYEQATAYSLNFGIDGVIFVYENRDTCAKKSYLFTVTQEMRNALIDKIKTCDKHLETRTVPPKTTNKRICYYCAYKDLCKKDLNIPEVKPVARQREVRGQDD